MNEVDLRAERAADALLRAVQVDPQAGLDRLHRTRRRRARSRTLVALASVVVLAATTWTYRSSNESERIGNDEARVATRSHLAPGETEIVSDRTASGSTDAIAVLRAGQPAVVRVGPAGSPDQHVVWSAPTAHELGNRNLPWPAAVAWGPDESELAILVAQEQGPVDDTKDLVDLTLVTVGADGSDRRIHGVIGTCWCQGAGPTLSWTGTAPLEVVVPDGPDRGVQRRTLQ